MLFTLLLELIGHTFELISVQTIHVPIEQSMIGFVLDLFSLYNEMILVCRL